MNNDNMNNMNDRFEDDEQDPNFGYLPPQHNQQREHGEISSMEEDADSYSQNADDDQRSVRGGNRLFAGSVVRESNNNEEKAVVDATSPMEEVVFDLNGDAVADVENPVFAKPPAKKTPEPPSRSIPNDDVVVSPKKPSSAPQDKDSGAGLMRFVFFVLFAAVVAGVVIFATDSGDDSSDSNSGDTPTTVVVDPVSASEDDKPLTKPDGFDEAILPTKRQHFVQMVVESGISDSRDFNSLMTPQGKAASFIAYIDANNGLSKELPQVIDNSDNFKGWMDRYVLMVLYHSTGGPSRWTNNSNFGNKDVPTCQWYGVQCTDGVVTGLDMSNNGLVGMLPHQEMTYLKVSNMDVSSNMALRGDLSLACESLQRGDDNTAFLWKADSCDDMAAANMVQCDCCAC